MGARRGRPINQELLDRMIEELQNRPRTIKSLAEDLEMSKRTAYRYMDRAVENGINIVKLGMAKDSPYFVMAGRNTKAR